MKRRVGRPRIRADSRRTVHFKVCVTPARFREVTALARTRHVSVSTLANLAIEELGSSDENEKLAQRLAVRVEQLENECAIWERILGKHHARTEENIRALADQLFNRKTRESADVQNGTGKTPAA
jgi:hypothetical protein